MKNLVRNIIADALKSAKDSGDIKMAYSTDILVEEPRNSNMGDYATNIAMIMAKSEGKNPRVIAEVICGKFDELLVIFTN